MVVDESLCTHDDARRLIDANACDIFNIRVSKNGGLINAGRLHRLAREAGLRSQLGAQVGETGFLSAAGRHFATRFDDILWLEGSFAGFLLEKDIVEPDIVLGPDGRARALEGPGLGVEPIRSRLESYTVESTAV